MLSIMMLSRFESLLPGLVELYKDLHAHPELSFDALPVAEKTGLDCASTATGVDQDGRRVPVMHACGHDMHVTCLLGALDLLAGGKEAWSGTVVAVFQPAEEIDAGARAMVDDGLFDRFGIPDVVLGQHVAPFPAGMVGSHPGPAMAASDSLLIRIFGRGGHASQPQTAIDPVVMAASTVMRLQTVVSREVGGDEMAVLTVGSLQAGTKDNIIPDEAELKVNIRTYSEPVRERVLGAVERIVRAEAAASGAERDPEISFITSLPVLVNDPDTVEQTLTAFREHFGDTAVFDPGPAAGSEDFGVLGTAAGVPACYWAFGGVDPAVFAAAKRAETIDRDIPANHSPFFAPVIEPSIDTGVRAMSIAALTWLEGSATAGMSAAINHG
jgi:hippurate hydrolase